MKTQVAICYAFNIFHLILCLLTISFQDVWFVNVTRSSLDICWLEKPKTYLRQCLPLVFSQLYVYSAKSKSCFYFSWLWNLTLSKKALTFNMKQVFNALDFSWIIDHLLAHVKRIDIQFDTYFTSPNTKSNRYEEAELRVKNIW